MTKKVIITYGVWGVGKTHYSKQFIERNPEYKLIDTHQDLPKLFDEMNSHDYCIMDYYFHLDPGANKMRETLGCEVEIIVLFDTPENISHRQIFLKTEQATQNNVDCFASKMIYEQDLSVLSSKFLDGDYKEYNYEAFRKKLLEYWTHYTKEMVEGFVADMRTKKGYDFDYHKMILPHGITIGREGYALNEEEWVIIKELVSWGGKRVIDCCGFHGAFAQYIYKEGGIITFFDISTSAVYSAAVFAKMNNTNFKIYVCDIDKELPMGQYDVALLLNVFHHLKMQDFVLKNLQRYPLVIFSINKEDKVKIKNYFDIIKEESSPKCNGNRIILLTKPK